MSELKESEISALRRACECLFIQVPAEVASDVKARAEAVIALLDQRTVPPAVPLDARELAKTIIQHLTATRLDWAQLWLTGQHNDLQAGKDVFEAIEEMIVAAALTTQAAATEATPSVSAAIAEVERLRDEWNSRAEQAEYPSHQRTLFNGKTDAANAIIEALRTLQPSTPSEKEND